jgi:hypothetical protein
VTERSATGSFPVEGQILVLSARAVLTESHRAALRSRLADAALDWEALLRSAADHRLLQLLAHHLVCSAADRVPEAVLGVLRESLMENTRLSLWVMRELHVLSRALAGEGIRLIAFKGTTLSKQLYGSPGLRAVGDLDVIVRSNDVEPALAAAVRLGYRPLHRLTPRQHQRLLRDGHHVGMVRDDGMYLEVHWDVAKSLFAFAVDMTGVWERAYRDPSGAWSLLADEDLLPILVIQASKDAWRALERLAGIAETASRLSPSAWDAAMASAERWQAARTLRVGLLLARRVIGVDLPPRVRQWCTSDAAADAEAERVARGLFHRATLLETLRAQFALRETWSQKLRFALRSAFTAGPEDWVGSRLPERLGWLHVVFRPARLLASGRRAGSRRR